ncbi:MAG TPA: 1-acyl-sn-glycerol-3-phosphate acyltransferase [Chlorobaculum sp.]|uniref:1-acyl-sn-glycerol-3-phosphate acyltransferase n=1 Tax=Chlorobaculum tepidum (strain ATCC 49652 / DSM 12025 / NBRC 103806 / TLS) TaxID=194439 RepID=Q8KAW5_CHLTE|nr:lysophospholipid acyltransferase family protein [Chlorobaculum tepidum]AAM73253.1 1-acyl-sn-glycerol-3-phosphate acyltransferase [Chlorobaculum tepidum TLS]HBU23367.1 1-acyl-sn-glycerol-3-phosphate acyltransferase [Chlorobaculum sp.]
MNFQTLLFFLVIIPVMFFGMLFALVLNLFDPSGDQFHKMAAWWGRFSARVLGIEVKVEGEENYNPNKNYLVVSNHAGMADIPLILGSMKLNLRFVAKEELGKIPVFGPALKSAGYVFIKRGQNREALQSMLKAADTLKAGRSIHIFPEGTRSKTGKILPFKRGAFIIAEKAKVPVLPVTIVGSNLITPKKSLKINHGTVRLIIGKPIEPAKAEALMKESYSVISENLEKSAA